jgi:hypothetical protein
MHVVSGAEPEAGDVVGLQEIEHLHDMHPRGGRRGRAEDLEAAIMSAHRLPVDNPVRCEILRINEALRVHHVVDERLPERAGIESARPHTSDDPQALAISPLMQACAGCNGPPLRQEEAAQTRVARDV